jgi:serine/threonine-protein kinase RsbT
MNTDGNIDSLDLARIPIVKMQDVLLARFIGREEAAKLGFSPEMLARIATAISEITRNVVQHARAPGEFRVARISEGERRGLRLVISDRGRGIDEAAQSDSVAKTSALGGGLCGSRRLMDAFKVKSVSDSGTTVSMDVWLR